MVLTVVRFKPGVNLTPEQLHALECRRLDWFEETKDQSDADFYVIFEDGVIVEVKHYRLPYQVPAPVALLFGDGDDPSCWKVRR